MLTCRKMTGGGKFALGLRCQFLYHTLSTISEEVHEGDDIGEDQQEGEVLALVPGLGFSVIVFAHLFACDCVQLG